MRFRGLVVAAVLVNLAATSISIWLTLRPDLAALEQRIGSAGLDEVSGLAWALTGAVLAWLRPRNALGWLFIGLGTCGTLSTALGLYAAFGLVWPTRGGRWRAGRHGCRLHCGYRLLWRWQTWCWRCTRTAGCLAHVGAGRSAPPSSASSC